MEAQVLRWISEAKVVESFSTGGETLSLGAAVCLMLLETISHIKQRSMSQMDPGCRPMPPVKLNSLLLVVYLKKKNQNLPRVN